ncbi:MAG TPA: exopolysaccharide transport family protein, partial [Hyphomicrobiaceae bacterium]|nr:exopolysaccharide transport family protein [Hyphomicrobiaceae bacterium]
MRFTPIAPQSASAILSVAARQDQTDLGGLLRTLRRHAGQIALLTLAALLLGLAYLALATPKYTASTSIFIDPRYRKVVNEEVIQGGVGTDLSLVETQVAIITSDSVMRRVVEREKLSTDPEFVPLRRDGLLSSLRAMILGRPEPVDPVAEAMTALSRAVKVKRAQKTYVVEIEVTSTSPIKAARLADAFAEAYLADQSAAKAAEARRANVLIDGRLGELREQVRKAEVKVDEFKRSNAIIVSDGGLFNEQTLTRLNNELATARGLVAETKGRLDEINSMLKAGIGNAESLPDAVKSNLIQRLREQLAAVARREASLAAQLGPRHPVLIEARTQANELRGQIAAELRRIAAAAKSEHQSAVNREQELVRTLERSKGDTTKTQTAQIRLRELEREFEASREVLRMFLVRAKETREQENITTPDARVITPAAIPSRPSRPISWLVLSLAGLGGLGAGVVRALMGDHLDRSLRTGQQVVSDTGLKALANIPALEPRSGLERMTRRLKGNPADRVPVSFSDILTSLGDAARPADTPFRQAVLRLLARLRIHGRAGHPQVVMVASGHAETGTSATALALAYAGATSGERTLLVDGCSTDPELSQIFAATLKQTG